MKTKTVILFLALALFWPFRLAGADEASHRAAAEELLLLTNHDDTMRQVLEQVGDMMEQKFREMGASEELRPIFKKYTDRMLDMIREQYSFANMKDDLIAIYTRIYTEEEILAISAFYKSPAGRKYVEKMPRLMKESMAVTQAKMQEMMQKIQVIGEEMTEEIEQLEATKKLGEQESSS